MLRYNTLVLTVIAVKDIPVKPGKSLDAYASLVIMGTDKWRSKVTTHSSRLDSSGSTKWDEHLEFQLEESFTDLQVNINCKTKLGTSETLATMRIKLSSMPISQSPNWYQLHKKGQEDKRKGMVQMAFEFGNNFGSSVSQISLNKIGKENKLDKLKRKMNFGKKKAHLDTQSVASLYLNRRDSIYSNASSALPFNSSPSPSLPTSSVIDNAETLSLDVRDESFLHDEAIHFEALSNTKKFGSKLRQKADQLLSKQNRRQSVINDDNPNYTSIVQSRPLSTSSGFASTGSGNLDQLNESTSKNHLLFVIDHLRQELQVKEHRIQDLEGYVSELLVKVMDAHPDLLQIK